MAKRQRDELIREAKERASASSRGSSQRSRKSNRGKKSK